jgi:DNA-3-methyladenine glycosylase
MPPRRLCRDELPADTVALARYLIGKVLVHDLKQVRVSGRIVETEAYIIGDPSGHAFRGKTRSNRSLFLEHGRAYVYFTYGQFNMMNVTSESPGVGAGVLVRALEPIEGLAVMARRRGTSRLLDLARGPGRLTSALGIDRRRDGLDLCARGPLWLGDFGRPAGAVGRSVRIGLTREQDRPLRFFEKGNPFVSGPKRLRT